jgi:hypothetical protein
MLIEGEESSKVPVLFSFQQLWNYSVSTSWSALMLSIFLILAIVAETWRELTEVIFIL